MKNGSFIAWSQVLTEALLLPGQKLGNEGNISKGQYLFSGERQPSRVKLVRGFEIYISEGQRKNQQLQIFKENSLRKKRGAVSFSLH